MAADHRIILRQVIVEMPPEQQSGDSHRAISLGGVMTMAILMMAMCVGTVVAISLASAVGGPIAWTLAVLAILGLALAHMKFMNHGGH